MKEPRWYVIASTGASNFVGEQLVAEKFAKEWDYQFPKSAPHRAVQLVDAAELEKAQRRIAELEQQIEALQAEAIRYRWLRDNGHLNKWWSSAGPTNRCENIDVDIDAAMTEHE